MLHVHFFNMAAVSHVFQRIHPENKLKREKYLEDCHINLKAIKQMVHKISYSQTFLVYILGKKNLWVSAKISKVHNVIYVICLKK